jgi:hypothetical protein
VKSLARLETLSGSPFRVKIDNLGQARKVSRFIPVLGRDIPEHMPPNVGTASAPFRDDPSRFFLARMRRDTVTKINDDRTFGFGAHVPAGTWWRSGRPR